MITIQSPIEIKTELGTVLITVDKLNGRVLIETFQRHGKRKYRLDTNILDGKLNEEK